MNVGGIDPDMKYRMIYSNVDLDTDDDVSIYSGIQLITYIESGILSKDWRELHTASNHIVFPIYDGVADFSDPIILRDVINDICDSVGIVRGVGG